MNDAEAEIQKARVMAEYHRWSEPLGMGYQRHVEFSWHRGPIPDHSKAAMVCTARWQYKTATIDVELTRIERMSDGELEFCIVHEIMHVFMGGLIEAFNAGVDGPAFRMIEEHTATTLAQAVMWLRAHCEPDDPAA